MNSEAHASSSSSLIGLLAFGVSAGIVLYFAYRQDYLTASVAATISLAAFSGYRVGAVKLLAFLLGGGVALLYARTWGAMMVERLELAESAAPLAIGGVGLAVALCGVASGHGCCVTPTGGEDAEFSAGSRVVAVWFTASFVPH